MTRRERSEHFEKKAPQLPPHQRRDLSLLPLSPLAEKGGREDRGWKGFSNGLYETGEVLWRDLDARLLHSNTERPHHPAIATGARRPIDAVNAYLETVRQDVWQYIGTQIITHHHAIATALHPQKLP